MHVLSLDQSKMLEKVTINMLGNILRTIDVIKNDKIKVKHTNKINDRQYTSYPFIEKILRVHGMDWDSKLIFSKERMQEAELVFIQKRR